MRDVANRMWDAGCSPVLTPQRRRPRVPRRRAREPGGKEGRKDVKAPKYPEAALGGEGRAAGLLRRAPSASQQPTEKKKNPQPNATQMEPPPSSTVPPPAPRPQPPARCPPRSPRHPAPLRSPLHSARWCVPQLQEIPDALHHAGCIPRPAKAPLQRTDMCWTSRAHDGTGISPLPAAAGDLLSARRSFSPFLFSTPAK